MLLLINLFINELHNVLTPVGLNRPKGARGLLLVIKPTVTMHLKSARGVKKNINIFIYNKK